MFLAALAAALSWLPWDEWVSVAGLFVVVFTTLALLHLGATLAYVRALWRATSKYSSESEPTIRGGLARSVALVMLFAGLYLAVMVCAPQAVELSNIANGVVPVGDYQIKLTRDGTELEIAGRIGVGLTKQVSRILNLNARIQSVRLNSQGGSAREARKLRDLIAQRKLSTLTSTGCFGECTLAFVAGALRMIGERAKLGFYQSALPGMPQWALWRDYEQDRRDWLARGFSAVFVDQALTTPESAAWQPSLSELTEAKVVSPAVGMFERNPAGGGQDILAVLDRELTRAPFFALLKEQEPESYRKLAGEIHTALQSSASDQDIQLRIHPMAKAVSYQRLSYAADALLLEYASVILEQISLLYSQGAKVCNRYFSMDLSGAALDAAKYFSEDMLGKEADLMAVVLKSSSEMAYQPPAKEAIQSQWDAIMALIGKRYGARAGLFFEPRQGKPDANQSCHVLYEFYKAVSRLPARQAGPLLRYHFAQLRTRTLPPTPPANAAKQVTIRIPPGANPRVVH